MRLLYSGPADDTANVKRFEDDAIPAALATGWRLTRAQPDVPQERDEPNPDAPRAETTDATPTDNSTAPEAPLPDPKSRRLKR